MPKRKPAPKPAAKPAPTEQPTEPPIATLTPEEQFYWQRRIAAFSQHPGYYSPRELALMLVPPLTHAHQTVLTLALMADRERDGDEGGVDAVADRLFPPTPFAPCSPFVERWYSAAREIDAAIAGGELAASEKGVRHRDAIRWARAKGFALAPEWAADGAALAEAGLIRKRGRPADRRSQALGNRLLRALDGGMSAQSRVAEFAGEIADDLRRLRNAGPSKIFEREELAKREQHLVHAARARKRRIK